MAHTLTFDGDFHVLVNDVVVSSPYTLQNGDVITVQVPIASGGYLYYADYMTNGFSTTAELDANTPANLAVSDSDITLTARNGGGSNN